MLKTLVIVESPAKAKTINKYLGNDKYIVKSSIGHIRDLSIKKSKNSILNNNKKDLLSLIGIDPYKSWKANYEVLPGKKNIVSELKKIANKVDTIYLATDFDREGESIAWHLKEVIGGNKVSYKRIIFNEITKHSINKAFNNPVDINMHVVNAQQARRFIDRIVGFMLSPLLWKKISRGLSAGRVQSVAVRLIVDREKKIKSFIPKEYWSLSADLKNKNNENIIMQVVQYNNKKFCPINIEQINKFVDKLNSTDFFIHTKKNKITTVNPKDSFITSTLQQTANTMLGFNVKKTMLIAQNLYEAGYITYIRTDSTYLSEYALLMLKTYIEKNFGDNYLKKEKFLFFNKKNTLINNAHEAIRPSDVNISFHELKNGMKNDHQKLYKLIFDQFISSHMKSAKYITSIIKVTAGNFMLQTKEKKQIFDGWMKFLKKNDNKESILPTLQIGEQLYLNKTISNQNFTKPPSRFSEASLVHELEKKKIGRPSTYALIISAIQSRGYVNLLNNKFYSNKIGEIVTFNLKNNFEKLMNYNFTAYMEERFDLIANNITPWKNVLNEFFLDFVKHLEIAKKEPDKGGMQNNIMKMTDINCSICSRNMCIRITKIGIILSCSGYNISNKKITCKNIINLLPEEEFLFFLKNTINNKKFDDKLKSFVLKCLKCNCIMDNYLISDNKKNKIFYLCSNFPQCDIYKIRDNEKIIEYLKESILKCEKCNSNMIFKIGKFGKYISCTQNKCKNTRKILKNGKISQPKKIIDPIHLPNLRCRLSDSYFVLRDSPSYGIFLASNNFPKSHETRSLFVEELKKLKKLLPKELHYLSKAPEKDDQGNKTVILFNSRTKQQYIGSEKNKKNNICWYAYFIDNKWKTLKK